MVAQFDDFWSNISAKFFCTGAAALAFLLAANLSAQASSARLFASSGYEARLSVSVPLVDTGLARENTSVMFSANKTSLKLYAPEYGGHIKRTTATYAFISFTGDAYLKNIDAGLGNRHTNSKPAASARNIVQASARATSRPLRRKKYHLNTTCKTGPLPGHISKRRLINIRVHAAYCRATMKHRAMVSKYRRYKTISARHPSIAMPELAGGVPQSTNRKTKHAYFDYGVARDAYRKALGEYKHILSAARGAMRR